MRRRSLLKAGVCAPLLALPGLGLAANRARELHLSHTHTGERLAVTYFDGRGYLPDALSEIDFLLRDFRTDDIHNIDPGLLDFVHRIQTIAGSTGAVEIISAYRSPATNEMLRRTSSGVAKKSYHMRGQALDIRLTDTATAKLRRVAASLGMGGVGYYPHSDFLHVDLGPVRQW